MDKINFPQLEEGVLKFWEKNKIFEKSLKNRGGAPRFVFYEGPPYANGKPGIHHVLGRVFKDLFCRYKTMRGFLVERKAGWDTHGLPVEFATEKELGFKTKKDIEKYGIDKFNQKCRENVWKYKDEWENITKRIGFWLDLKRPYITYGNNYIESLWWIIKQIYDKGLLVQDYRVAPYCPRCGTTLSSHELAQGYREVEENSIYVKFPVSKAGKFEVKRDEYFLVWTTTPWTLPGNVALAVNRKESYVKVKAHNCEKNSAEFWILEKKSYHRLVQSHRGNIVQEYRLETEADFSKDGQEMPSESLGIVEEVNMQDLIGTRYEPLYDFVKPDKPAYRVIADDFVSTEEGTGIVHIAPAFGEDDMRVGKENDLPVLMTVGKEGKFIKDVKPWAGKFVKDADKEIIEELKGRNLFYNLEKYEHDYPFCWRCESPLLYYALTSWFIKVTEIKNKLLENSKTINWAPDYLKDGRFGEWLKEVKDWNFSRERYWGVPLPIWKCEKCNELKCVGNIKELEELGGKKIDDLHRPYVDEVTFKCDKCGGKMRRVPEVVDIWFDSGAMPFAQWHYPFENKNYIDKREKYPADFICEGMDQTRGWFYTLLAVATLLDFEPPYKNVVSYGLVLDKYGKKMSKSKGNTVEVNNVINKFGVDALRWYFYTVNAVGMSTKFFEEDVGKSARGFISTLWNCYSFWKLYSVNPVKNYSSNGTKKRKQPAILKPKHILDKWLLSEFNLLMEEIIGKLDKYDLVGASRLIETFLNDFSNWYLRRSRERIKNNNPDTLRTFYEALVDFTKLLAPFIPFASDYIFKEMTGQSSVHLEEFPKPNKKLIDEKLHQDMEIIRKIASIGLRLRVKAGIKVRQPLRTLAISTELRSDYIELLKDEMNVKEISLIKNIGKDEPRWVCAAEDGLTVLLDTEISPQLKEEGILREIIRHIQELRKKANLTPKDKITIYWTSDDGEVAGLIEKNREEINKDTISADIKNQKAEKFLASKEINIDNKKLFINIK